MWRLGPDGVLVCRGNPLGYLFTNKDYTDFDLRLQWRWPEGKPGKGGVLVRMTGPDKIWPASLEAQLNFPDAGDFWGLDGYDLSGPASRLKRIAESPYGKLVHLRHAADFEKPAGQWNTYEIHAAGGTVVLRINGHEVNRATDCLVRPGKICLTSEGSEIHFRHIELKAQETTSGGIRLESRVQEMPGLEMGPFVRLDDKTILTVDEAQSALVSKDDGRTWQKHPIFAEPARYAIRPERALVRTAKGIVILAFLNEKEAANWNWDTKTSDAPRAKLPTYAVRSLDGGKTWQDLQKLHDDWTGAIRDIIQTRDGRVVFTSMMMLHDPGRHATVTYSSADEGKTWKRSNLIDLGGQGHHSGAMEPTLEQLRDGRLWMLIRTNLGSFWEATSNDGVFWRTLGPTSIDASTSPGMLKRLQSGRLALIWNRWFPEGKTDFPLHPGDKQFSEVPVSAHRMELSIMFSDDDGKTWTTPVVLARLAKGSLAYPYLFESRPGELWITTMQGGLRAKLFEKDFAPKRG